MAKVWIILLLCACVHLASGQEVNLARGKPVNASSRFGNRDPRLGVDGNTTQYDPNIMHTNVNQSYGAWWVDLQTQVQDPTVKIYFRILNGSPEVQSRRASVQVYTANTPFTSFPPGDQPCYTTDSDYSNVPVVVTFTNCSGTWRHLMVYRQAGDNILDFGEVEVLDCSTGNYGENCLKSCSSRHCAETPALCDRLTGACPNGCYAGWTGMDCTQVCSSESYGANCEKNCSDRQCAVKSTTCDRTTGACNPAGCKSGYRGTDCVDVCGPGTYGLRCKNCTDRRCKNSSSSCYHVTGECVGGCEVGWNGTDCMQQCPNGTFGTGCFNCSIRHCQGEVGCSGDGACSEGCEDGWTLNNCTMECPNGTFGTGCFNCSIRHCQGEVGCSGDGACSEGCEDGWTLNNCTMACPNGTFGRNCSSKCGNCTGDDICDHVMGTCPNVCNAGWQGEQCKEPIVRGKDFITMPAVAGAVAAVVVIVIIAVIVIVWKRRRSSEDNKPLDSQTKRALNVGDTYVNVVNVDENAATKSKPPIKPTEKQTAEEKVIIETKSRSSRQLGEPNADPDHEEEIQDEEDISPSNDYYNVDDTEEVIREIPVRDLEKTIQKIRNRKGGFEAEYNRLPSGFMAPYDDSQKPENSGKNKFRGLYPYDHNRVQLSTIPDIPGSDYINASTMHSYDQGKTYIAAQAPNKKTVGDFWRMIWEQHCGRVVMLTGLVEGGKVKCYQYWPDDDSLDTDQFRVEVEVTDTRANYTVRHLKVTSKDNGQRRLVVQYHYTSWPDHGVPDTLALIHFIWMIRHVHTQTDGPLLVHCSAGIGRTGTYIAVDSLLDQAQSQGMVDIQGYVSVMRGQRKNMIQTKEQYECVFLCLMEMTRFGNTSMDVETFTTTYSDRGMDSVVDRKTIRELTQMVVTEVRSDPPARHRMWVNGNEDFIVRVGPTLRQLRGYVQAVTPPPGLEKLLWKLVEENNVQNTIVMSQENVVGELGSEKKYGDIVVTRMKQNNLSSDLTMTTVQLQITGEDSSRSIKLYKFNCPPSLEDMSPLLLNHAHLHQLSTEITPVVIIHSESDRKCVVALCIMGNILSGILEDHRVDVIGHVRTFLKCCPDVTFTEEDIEKLYQFAQKCVEMTEATNTYANL